MSPAIPMHNETRSDVEAPPPPVPSGRPARAHRATAKDVLFFDKLAGLIVRLGGMLVMVAVVGILVFLAATVLPLFQAAEVRQGTTAGRVPVEGTVRLLALDEYRLLAAAVGDAPEVVVFRPDTAEIVRRLPVPGLEDTRISRASASIRNHELTLASADGRISVVKLTFPSDFILGKEGDALRAEVKDGQVRTMGDAVVQRKAGGNLLRVKAELEPKGTISLPRGSAAPVAASFGWHEEEGAGVVLTADGKVHVLRGSLEEGGEGAARPTIRLAPLAEEGPGLPAGLFFARVDEEGRNAWFASREGALLRVDLTKNPAVRREVKYVGTPGGTRLTAAEFVLGSHSIVVADEEGRATIWSTVPLPTEDVGGPSDPGDARVIRKLHDFAPFGSKVTTLTSGSTRRTVYLGHEDGSVSMFYSTNERVLAHVDAFKGGIVAIASGARDDGIVVVGPGLGFRGFEVDCPHPEMNLHALFGAIHYEGYANPSYEYQSSASTDEAETKLSLRPLLFGTLKATFYAMLFALPLALLGALYTSQFMHARVRSYVKPGVEVMASLPSVVLGFVAARVLAPNIESVVPGLFSGMFGVVLIGMLAGFVWYVLPTTVRQAFTSGQRLLVACFLAGVALWMGLSLNGPIQESLFSGPANPGGDFRTWLRCEPGTGSGLPLLRLGLGFIGGFLGLIFIPRFVRVRMPAAGRFVESVVKALTFVVLPAAVFALLAGPVEHLVFHDGFRWFLVGQSDKGTGTTYSQSNCIVVGIAMGFAVIPIIYTITEDALSAIPDSLKSAALGCGASPWQAATRVILPAAVPGIFSAIMIGLGRAIGETMSVLMAAGGTAIMDWSIFNGLRTLSVNIATELPEAPQGGTLYRVLFLAGLLLFLLTFVLNTAAEAVRIRFRKKFKGL